MAGPLPADAVRIVARDVLYKGHWTLEKITLQQTRRDGTRQTLERELFSRPDAASVLLHDPDRDTVLLTRQFRLPALLGDGRPSLIETAAGLIEDSAAACAEREAIEETGYRPRNLTSHPAAYMSPGGLSERVFLFTAEYGPQDRVDAGGGIAHEGEDIEVVELPFDRAFAMIATGEIADAKTIILLQHLKIAKLSRA